MNTYNVVAYNRISGNPYISFRDVTPRTEANAQQEADRRNREDAEREKYRFAVMEEEEAGRQ